MSGNVGSERRLEYTALGDTTNTAARLEGMTKGTPHQLYISDTTKQKLTRAPDDLVEVGEAEVRGRKGKVLLWSLRDGDAPREARAASSRPSRRNAAAPRRHVVLDDKRRCSARRGATHTIVYTREDFVERVRELTSGKRLLVVYDSVGKDTFERSLDCLAPRGLLVSFGNSSGKPPALELGLLAQKGSLFVTRPTLFSYIAARKELVASAKALFDVVQSGHVKIEIGRRLPLSEAAEAHRLLESRATTGSLVLIP